eukprot:3441792-Amphidinium_carterae.1
MTPVLPRQISCPTTTYKATHVCDWLHVETQPAPESNKLQEPRLVIAGTAMQRSLNMSSKPECAKSCQKQEHALHAELDEYVYGIDSMHGSHVSRTSSSNSRQAIPYRG